MACSSVPERRPVPDDTGGSGGEAGEAAAGAANDCIVALPSPELIASTPRGDTNLELLALRLSTGVVAEQDVYERVVRDVAAIRAEDPSLAEIGYYPRQHDGRSLFLALDFDAFASIQNDRYHDWDCLNDAYVVEKQELSDAQQFAPFVELTLKGIYDLKAVALDYAELPGITGATPNVSGGDGPTLCVTREADDVWQWVVDRASGDCLGGCTSHEYFHFTTQADGELVSHGELEPSLVASYASSAACR